MALRFQPPGEDPVGPNNRYVPSLNKITPHGEDGIERAEGEELENQAAHAAAKPDGVDDDDDNGPTDIDFLQLVREAESQAQLYSSQANRRAWSQTLRAYHNEHYVGSKYTKPEWRGRSKLFIPKTRAAVRKDNAAVAASLFNSIDAINCLPGNEADPKQKAAAAVMQELVNYRTNRASGKAAFPWFLLSMGARQDAVLTGVCGSKQYWKTEYRKTGDETVPEIDQDGQPVLDAETGQPGTIQRDVYTLEVDRPDMAVFPPENYVIDAAADWTNPAQSAAFFIIKWPMQIEEIKAKQNAPVNPWKNLSEAVLKSAVDNGKQDVAAIRRAREMGLDRLNETTTGTHFQIIWVYETFIRTAGDDYTFFSIGDQHYLTDPAPVREVYPEQHGERPISLGYASLESHRIYPMSPAESWQPLQIEVNDVRNLMLDATKQNVMPISKVVRGKQVDLDQVRRRSSGSSIMVTNKDDVTWETPPSIPQQAMLMSRELNIELDDLAGQQNYGNVEQSNALGKTLGGLKLAAGAANAVQEYDVRVWLETWAEPALAQIVRLEQYYEHDSVVLGLCGEKAQLFEKFGIDKIDDELLEQDITVRVSAGLGAGDPQQRLAKFQSAATIAAPLLAQSKEFQSGQKRLNTDAIIEEIFGAAGYKDGGARFFIDDGQPASNPMADLKTEEIKAKIEKDKQQGKAAMLNGLAALANAALGKRELEASTVDMLLGHQMTAHQMGADHAHRHMDQHLKATDHGHRHGMAIAEHRRNAQQQEAELAAQQAGEQPEAGEGAGMEGAAVDSPPAAPSSTASPEPSPASSPPAAPPGPDLMMQMLAKGEIEFTRDAQGRIAGMKLKPAAGRPQGATPPIPVPAH